MSGNDVLIWIFTTVMVVWNWVLSAVSHVLSDLTEPVKVWHLIFAYAVLRSGQGRIEKAVDAIRSLAQRQQC